ncbi:unnamed protein product [Rotaria sp. Silwood2]|nr:unnamed protein product [Rotaria sp. Silwood2]
MAMLDANSKWIQNGVTVAGGNGGGNGMNQLCNPWSLYVDDDQAVYVVDNSNNRIVKWICGATTGLVVVGGNGQGNLVQWARQSATNGKTIISDIECIGLTVDDDEFLYITDNDKHEVRRFRMGESKGTVEAGENGPGSRLDQFDQPRYAVVDRNHSMYISDINNHRVMKWMKDTKQGIVVAGGQYEGNSLGQLSDPHGIIVDQSGTIYIADYANHRIMRWLQGTTEGSVIVGGNGQGSQSNQFCYPVSLSFDREGNLYVSDLGNHRVQKFNIDRS